MPERPAALWRGSSPEPGIKDLSDEQLVRRLGGGEKEALAELYDRYSRPVYATGLRILQDSSVAEELVQDVFLQVWRKAESYEPGRASFSTWLYGISHNRSLDLLRQRRVRPASAGADALEWLPSKPESGLDPQSRVDGWDVARALSRLAVQHREILVLAYQEGLTQREISRRTGLPLGTVKSRTTAALKRLRSEIPDPQEVEND